MEQCLYKRHRIRKLKRSKPTVNHNDYGEKLGLDRIQEIIDTHDWLNCEVLPATKIREEIPNEMPSNK